MKMKYILVPLIGLASLGYLMFYSYFFNQNKDEAYTLNSLDPVGPQEVYLDSLLGKIIVDACLGPKESALAVGVSGYIKVSTVDDEFCSIGRKKIVYTVRCSRPEVKDVELSNINTRCIEGNPMEFKYGLVNDVETEKFLIRNDGNRLKL